MTRQAKAWLVILSAAVLSVVIIGVKVYPFICNAYFSNKQTKADYDHAVQVQNDAQVPSGFLVQKVPLLSAATLAGLQPGDIITKYNNLPVTSVKSYYTAIDRILADKTTSVTLTVMRAGKPIQLTAPAGLLGFQGENWSPFTDRIFDLLANDRIDDAASLLAKAGRSVPEEQLLMAQIALLPEMDSSQDEHRDELMDLLMPLLFETDFDDLGEKCMKVHRYKAAQVFLSKVIEADPEDISAREDLAASYQRAGQFEEAGRIVDDIVANHSTEMSDYGWHVLLSTRAEVYRNRKDYAAAAADFRKAMEYFPDDDDTNLRLGYLQSVMDLLHRLLQTKFVHKKQLQPNKIVQIIKASFQLRLLVLILEAKHSNNEQPSYSLLKREWRLLGCLVP